ncbi:MAG: hypothetical protein IJV36_02470, partial [Prevotella sp.]|nr:hypothetical protein [Prevotella sp.]
HFFGMPGLLSTMHLCGRSEPLTVVAPKGARQALETYFELTGNHHNYPIEWVEMEIAEGSTTVYECSHYTVEAFPLVHSVPTFGFRITERTQTALRPRTYVYCCDTAYDTSLLPFMAGADLLCLESTYLNEYAPLAGRNMHLTVGQATSLARMAGASWLLLTHISARFRDPQAILDQARLEFENSIVAADNMQLFISRKEGVSPLQNTERQPVEATQQK